MISHAFSELYRWVKWSLFHVDEFKAVKGLMNHNFFSTVLISLILDQMLKKTGANEFIGINYTHTHSTFTHTHTHVTCLFSFLQLEIKNVFMSMADISLSLSSIYIYICTDKSKWASVRVWATLIITKEWACACPFSEVAGVQRMSHYALLGWGLEGWNDTEAALFAEASLRLPTWACSEWLQASPLNSECVQHQTKQPKGEAIHIDYFMYNSELIFSSNKSD